MDFSFGSRDLLSSMTVQYHHQQNAREEVMLSPRSTKASLTTHLPTTIPQIIPKTPESLHYDRKVHFCYHDHHSKVIPAPETAIQPEKYASPGSISLRHSHRRLRNKDQHIDAISNVLAQTSITSKGLGRNNLGWVSPRRFTSEILSTALHGWSTNSYFMADAAIREKHNPFTGINMNSGWNRAKAELMMHFYELHTFCPVLKGGVEELVSIREGFAGFSLREQNDGFVLDEKELLGMGFALVFKGSERGCGWAGKIRARERKGNKGFGVAACCKGVCFEECNEKWVEGIVNRVDAWEGAKGQEEGWSKRKRGYYEGWRDVAALGRKKRTMMERSKSEKVWSEAWRARRRIQEMNRGRWTDGTMRMDRMWDAFHWVLKYTDPLKCKWAKDRV